MLAKRRAMPAHVRERLSASICSRLLGMPQVAEAAAIGIYMPFENEVDVDALLMAFFANGKKVFVPVMHRNGGMKFAVLKSRKDTAVGYGSIRIPRSLSFAGSMTIGVFVVPGIAFDRRGFRIGFGGGHYDRFFSRGSGAVKIGVAYDFQVVGEVDAKAHDVRMDFVVTEKRIIKT
jgi:5-formyltetrahydrofolate cyclo-ligase